MRDAVSATWSPPSVRLDLDLSRWRQAACRHPPPSHPGSRQKHISSERERATNHPKIKNTCFSFYKERKKKKSVLRCQSRQPTKTASYLNQKDQINQNLNVHLRNKICFKKQELFAGKTMLYGYFWSLL